jgi:hypothetical protein
MAKTDRRKNLPCLQGVIHNRKILWSKTGEMTEALNEQPRKVHPKRNASHDRQTWSWRIWGIPHLGPFDWSTTCTSTIKDASVDFQKYLQ